MFANFPASQEIPGYPYERVYVVAVKNVSGLRVPRIQAVSAMSIFASGRTVRFR
jgi:hypothetical protein